MRHPKTSLWDKGVLPTGADEVRRISCRRRCSQPLPESDEPPRGRPAPADAQVVHVSSHDKFANVNELLASQPMNDSPGDASLHGRRVQDVRLQRKASNESFVFPPGCDSGRQINEAVGLNVDVDAMPAKKKGEISGSRFFDGPTFFF